MPTLITIAGANFSANALAVVPPAIAGLQTWCLFGANLTGSQNQVPGGPALTAIGTPAYSSSYVTCTPGTNGFDTNLAQSTGVTAIIAARQAVAGSSEFWGNYDGTNGVSVAIAPTGIFGKGNGMPGALNAGIVATGFALYAVSIADGVTPMEYDLTHGTSASGSPGTPYVLSARTPQIGSAPALFASYDTAAVDIAFLAQYQNVALSGAQLTSLVPSIRAALAARGITV